MGAEGYTEDSALNELAGAENLSPVSGRGA